MAPRTPGDDEAWKVADGHRLTVPRADDRQPESEWVADEAPTVDRRGGGVRWQLLGAVLAAGAAVWVWYPRAQEASTPAVPERSGATAGGVVEEAVPAALPATRVEAVRLRRALASFMRERGLGRGDSPELDETLDRLAAAFDQEAWAEAREHVDAAREVARDLEITATMVRAKLARVERRAERTEDGIAREKLDVGILEGRVLLDEGELEAAHRRLHEAILEAREAGEGSLGEEP